MAMLRELAKRFHYGAHFAYPALQIGDVCFSEALHFARGTLLVAPEREQGGDFIEREAQIAGAANELKHSHVLVAVIAAPGRTPRRLALLKRGFGCHCRGDGRW